MTPTLTGDGAVQGVALHEDGVPCAPSVRLQYVHGLHGVLDVTARVDSFDGEHRVDRHGGKHIVIAGWISTLARFCNKRDSLADDLARHARLCGVDQRLLPKRIHLDAQLVLHVLHCLPARKTVAGDDRRGVDLRLDELICAAQKLGGNDDDGRSAITDLLVLLLCEIDENAACGVIDGEEGEDGSAIIRDGDFLHRC